MLETVTDTLGTLADTLLLVLGTLWFWLGRPGLNPLSWNGLTWIVAGLFLLVLALFLRSGLEPKERKPRTPDKPNLMISKGAVQQLENSSLQHLNFTISNLGHTPVQLLELVLQTNRSRPITVEAVELLLPHEMVELEATLPTELLGDSGSFQAFAYVAQRKGKLYTLRAKLVWEAWEKRFKISPTGQSLQVARKLHSERLSALRQQTWQAQNSPLQEASPPELVRDPEPPVDSKKTQTTVKVKKTLDLDFPTKF